MKTDKNILIAFLLNIFFSIMELFGGIFTNSVAIISDAIHDCGDAISIGISYFLERKSKKEPDSVYTYGYARYSILGAIITTSILSIGSIIVIFKAISRIISPEVINYDGMIIISIIGIVINFIASYFTKDGDSLNQKAVNLHMLEDVLGWVVVFIGSVVIKFTDITIIDSIMSIGVALFIFINTLKNFKDILDLFLEKIPANISIDEITKHILEIEGVKDVHHIHVWSIDGENNYATMHVVTENNSSKEIKNQIKEELKEHGISHITIELEDEIDHCEEHNCHIDNAIKAHAHHH